MSKSRTIAGNLGTTSGEGGGGVTSYANAAALPSSGNTAGDLAFTLDKKAMYNWDGSEWDRIFSGPNETLTWDSALSSTYLLPGAQRLNLGYADSSKAILNFSASADPEGFPVTYSYEMIPSYPIQLDSAYGDDSASGGKGLIDSSDHPTRPRITLMPSIRDSDAGTFTFRVTATDGTHKISSTTLVSLRFSAFITMSGGTVSDNYTYTSPNGTVVTTVEANYNQGGYGLQGLFNNDGDETTTGAGTANGGTYFLGGQTATSNYLTFNFSASTVSYIEKIRVHPWARSDTFSDILSIETSADGSNWTQLYGDQGLTSINTPENTWLEYTIDNQNDYLRIQLDRTGQWGTSFGEISLYGTAT